MHPIIYDVAVSLDGFIAGPDGDISGFAHEGPVVDAYFERLKGYACAIMGRATYEFGYRFGLTPGASPYPHMKTVVFSRSLAVPDQAEISVVRDADPMPALQALRQSAGGPIYLCGGGAFAGTLLRLGQIDQLRLKRAPCLLGAGTALFDAELPPHAPAVLRTETYEYGYVYQAFDLRAPTAAQPPVA